MYQLHDENYYDKIAHMEEEQLSELWQEETLEDYEEMLEILPPIRWVGQTFMVGECVTIGKHGSLYDIHTKVGQRYFKRPGYIRKFNPEFYAREIQAMFYGQHPKRATLQINSK
jgi:hypothetical protein